MKYSAYGEYQEGNNDWLGNLPSHWEKFSLKRKFRIINGSTPKSGEARYWDGDLLWVTPADFSMQERGYLSVSSRHITQAGLESCGTTLVEKGSVVLSTRAPIGEVVQAGDKLCTNQGCKSLVVDAQSILERFFYYSLKASSEQLNILGLGTTFMELSKDSLGCYPVAFPPFEEQQKIAAFLDYKTQQIDQLIEKKKALIEKLEEKRIAVITQAVTKGLDKNAKLKPSGVDWLGDVPEHWGVRRLQFNIRTTKGYAFKSEHFVSSGVRVVKASDIKKKTIIGSDIFLPAEFQQAHRKVLLSEGDIVISTVGSMPDVVNSAVGQIGQVPINCDGALLNQNTVILRPYGKLKNEFFLYLLSATAFREHLDLHAHGTANQASLSLNDILNFPAALPPVEEQILISNHLEKVVKSINKLTSSAKITISKLNEYRSAIITSAVTGKIDVRAVNIPKAVA